MKLITSTEDLTQCCHRMSTYDYLAIDTEFIRKTTFWPELCLIQLATDQEAVIIDPLSKDISLKPFFSLMRNKKITKVFHAARQDIEIIYNLDKIIPAPIFDTQIAAMVLGYGDSVSYDRLVHTTIGITIDKSSRNTNWRQRPLTKKQLDYALSDVTHLCKIYPILKQKLELKQRAHWLNEEIAILKNPNTYDQDPENAWKRLKKQFKKPIELSVLKSIAAWRENEAREKNVPRGKIFQDETLYEISRQRPKDLKELSNIRTLRDNWKNKINFKSLLIAIEKGVSSLDEKRPETSNYEPIPEDKKQAVEFLKLLLKIIAQREGVAPKIIATSDDIQKLVLYMDQAKVPAMKGWRKDLFGIYAIDLLTGKLALKFDGKSIRLFNLEQPTSM